jgi:hypothetical protein
LISSWLHLLKSWSLLKTRGGSSAVSTRLELGWSTEQAFGLSPPPKRKATTAKQVSIDRITYPSIKAAGEILGISPSVLASRLRHGWSPEEAAGIRKHRKRTGNATSLSIAGRQFQSIREACEELGHEYGKIVSRMQLGWTLEQTFDLAPPPPPSGMKNGEPVKVNGVTYTSRSQAAKAFGIDPRQVHKRLKLGWSLERALCEPLKKHRGK